MASIGAAVALGLFSVVCHLAMRGIAVIVRLRGICDRH